MEEGREARLIISEVADGLIEFSAEVADHIGDDRVVGQRDAAVGEHVGEGLQVGAVLLDGEVPLEEVMELLESLQTLLVAVGEEKSVDRREQHVSYWVVEADDADDLVGDGVLEPTYNAPVYLGPNGVGAALPGIDCVVDVVSEAKRLDSGGEEG